MFLDDIISVLLPCVLGDSRDSGFLSGQVGGQLRYECDWECSHGVGCLS